MFAASLAPFPDTGEFNSVGMWLNIIFLLVFYILSLILYRVGVKGMKYVMAVFCGLGLLISFSIIVLSLVLGTVNVLGAVNNISDFLTVIVLCAMAFICNIIWYIVAFKKERIHKESVL